jgi:uncharacterized protein
MTGNPEEQSGSSDVRRYDALAAAAWIPEMVDRIVKEFDPQKIILFGSHARGDATRWSDIDLLVVFDEPVDNREMAISIQRILRGLFVAKDIVVTDEATLERRGLLIGTVYRPALLEGRVLYERS